MPLGITNTTNITAGQILDLVNVTEPMQIFVNINHTIFNGWLYFILLWVFFIILFFSGQNKIDSMGEQALYALIIVSVLSLFLRLINVVVTGITQGFLTDSQMWVFPILTLVLGAYLWFNNQS